MFSKILLSIILVSIVTVRLVKGRIQLEVPNEALDQNLYEEVIDPELCDEQVRLIGSNSFLTLFFLDAGIRVPRGIFEGSTIDMGNYHQCIGYNQPLLDYELQGKYCMIRVPINQNLHLPERPDSKISHFDPNHLRLDDETVRSLEEFEAMKKEVRAMSGIFDDDRSLQENPLSGRTFRLAVCIPKPCTTEQALTSLLFNVSSIGFEYTDDFCRLPDDKPWVPGDTVAVVIFSIIGLLTLISTSYDVWQTIILENDPKTVSVIGRSFSIYTNGRRIMTFDSGSDNIECLDGIRAWAMYWVLVGHTFSSETSFANPVETIRWLASWQSLWIRAAHITVDTFFTLSGFLVVYTTVGKFNGNQLLKNIHMFWLNRLLRMFPLLATIVLLEATYLNRMNDGPIWDTIERQVHRCRTYWWSTLLHIQNYVNPSDVCVTQTWYLAIDVQLHILSPVILFWVLLGRKRIAWTALLSGLVAILAASITYNFIKEFPATRNAPGRADRLNDYMRNYYVNTLTRASPFFVGMIFGYIVRTTKLKMSKVLFALSFFASGSYQTLVGQSIYSAQPTVSRAILDNLYNSFIRPLWALFICSMIYGCVSGYGGPINWFLTLKIWKLPSRLSYAMYLFHYGLMTSVNFSAVAPVFFSVNSLVFKFLAHYVLSLAVSYVMVLVIDAPCSTLFKILLGGAKKPPKKEIDLEPTEDNDKKV